MDQMVEKAKALSKDYSVHITIGLLITVSSAIFFFGSFYNRQVSLGDDFESFQKEQLAFNQKIMDYINESKVTSERTNMQVELMKKDLQIVLQKIDK